MTLFINPLNHTKDNDIIRLNKVFSIRVCDNRLIVDFDFNEQANACPKSQSFDLREIHDYLIQS